jgi:hypothetical protein
MIDGGPYGPNTPESCHKDTIAVLGMCVMFALVGAMLIFGSARRQKNEQIRNQNIIDAANNRTQEESKMLDAQAGR